jgi:hypothetical protein
LVRRGEPDAGRSGLAPGGRSYIIVRVDRAVLMGFEMQSKRPTMTTAAE